MSLSFGLNEPLSCPKIALFCGVMGVYFVSFFLEHPVGLISVFFDSVPKYRVNLVYFDPTSKQDQ